MSFKFKKIVLFFILLIFFIKPSLAEITFQEILENPADLEINLKYATEQEGLGRYKATLSTLERLNMLYPVNTDIKLYLISILLKMDSAAKLELMVETMLQDPNTTKETRDYIESILKTIRDQIEDHIKKSEDFNTSIGIAVRVDKFSDSSIDMYVRCFTKSDSWNEWLTVKEKLAIKIKQIVENNKASFAFPSQSIYIEKK